ncbi:MAG: glycosyltransferase family 2 protein [Anaerolineae bacterium]|nr:glycosyltransferase family 2 protein [Anaerolineae bacterium]
MPESSLTVLIPAYNEARVIGHTLRSLLSQTRRPDRIVVVDDRSSDETGLVAAALGAEVVRPASNTGYKAGALNYGLQFVDSEWLVTLDADTVLAPDALQQIVTGAQEEGAGAACGLVLPQRIRTLWERARFVEYLLAFGVLKPVQDWYRCPMVASGCFALYRTEIVKALGGFPTETVGEDLDLTWRLYEAGESVKYVSRAICYPVEPPSLFFMRRQLARWSHGFAQNVRLHGRRILGVPMLRSFVIVACLDTVVAGLVYAILTPYLVVTGQWRHLIAVYLADLALMAIPVLWMGSRLKRMPQAFASLPTVFVLRWLTVYYYWRAAILEWVLRRPLRVFVKGH